MCRVELVVMCTFGEIEMKLNLRAYVDGMYFNGGAVVEIPELIRREFEPLKTCDEPTACFVTGDLPVESLKVKIIMKTREDSAKILAEELTRMIVNEMKKNDEHNGYKKYT